MLSALKNFAVTFTVSAVIFGIIAALLCGYMVDTVTPVIQPPPAITNDSSKNNPLAPGDTQPDDTEDEEKIKGTSFNILLVGTDYMPSRYDNYVINESDDYIKQIYNEYLDYLDEQARLDAEAEQEKSGIDIAPASDIDRSALPDFSDIEYITGSDNAEQEDEENTENEEEDEYEEEKIDPNINILRKDYPRITADAIMLIRVDKENKQMTVTPIPSNTKVFVYSSHTTIGTLYTKYGVDFLVDMVTSITGIGIDYYSVINITEVPKLMEMVGSVEVNVAQDIYFYNNEYVLQSDAEAAYQLDAEKNQKRKPENRVELELPVLALAAGKQQINAENVTALLSFEDYSDGITGEMNTYLEFYKAFLAKALSEESLIKSQQALEAPVQTDTPAAGEDGEPEKEPLAPTYEETVKHILTNFPLETYKKQTDLIFSYPKFEFKEIQYPGEYKSPDGVDYFVPDVNTAISMFMPFRGESNLRKLHSQSGVSSSESDNDGGSGGENSDGEKSDAGPSVFN